ncbi:MAG: LysR family transcriptional regulator [Planctomycetes bacterium]|nr:LysR family transcriptional regulator [Planctomycetota bacterium]
MVMNPGLLSAFLVVRKHRNFTRAAEELFLSQPAVSRQIQQLERELGVSLFDRLGKSLHPTEAGETLAAEAERLLGGLDRAVEAVRSHALPGTGRLRIGAGTTPGLYILPPILGEFQKRYPNVEIHISIGQSAHVAQQVLRNEIDIGFVGSALNERELLTEPIADDEIVCFARSKHPAVKRRNIDIRSLSNETWIVRPKGSATRTLFDDWMTTKRCMLRRTIEIDSPEGIRALVEAGVGISYMSVHALHASVRQRQLAILSVKGLNLQRTIWAVRHIDKRATPSMQAFLQIVLGTGNSKRSRASVEAMKPKGEG